MRKELLLFCWSNGELDLIYRCKELFLSVRRCRRDYDAQSIGSDLKRCIHTHLQEVENRFVDDERGAAAMLHKLLGHEACRIYAGYPASSAELRFLHHAKIFTFEGDSYRIQTMKEVNAI